MTDILDEVLNDQNEEKRFVFFKRLLPIVIIISIIAITIMVITNNNKDTQIKNNQKNGDTFVKAVSLDAVQGNKELAISTLENLVGVSDTRIKEIDKINGGSCCDLVKHFKKGNCKIKHLVLFHRKIRYIAQSISIKRSSLGE